MKKNTRLLLFVGGAAVLMVAFFSTAIYAAPGDLYVSDEAGDTIFKFTPSGVKSTFASGLALPQGLAFDREGNLFVAEVTSGTIFKFTPTGVKTAFKAGLDIPSGLAFDGTGNLFVAIHGSAFFGGSQILKITPAGNKSTFASGLNRPNFGLVFDASSNLFLASAADDAVYKFSPTGTKTVFASGIIPLGLAFDSSGNLFVARTSLVGGTFRGEILKFTPAGVRTTFATGFGNPTGLAFDSMGNLFVAATDPTSGIGEIIKITSAGIKSMFASGLGYPAFLAFEPIIEKLRNTSARGIVLTGESVLIAGFILGGNALNNNAVIIRAIGPSLSRFGIANPLLDPILELHNASGVVIASNDNWQTSQRAQIVAAGLAPSDVHESAIYAQLGEGSYTAVVRGANATSGIALVEVYSIR